MGFVKLTPDRHGNNTGLLRKVRFGCQSGAGAHALQDLAVWRLAPVNAERRGVRNEVPLWECPAMVFFLVWSEMRCKLLSLCGLSSGLTRQDGRICRMNTI